YSPSSIRTITLRSGTSLPARAMKSSAPSTCKRRAKQPDCGAAGALARPSIREGSPNMKLYNPTFLEIISVLKEGAMELSRREFVTAAVSATAVAAAPASAISQEQAPTTKGDAMTTTLTPYLLFEGTCHPAMEFYKSCFGGELSILKVKDSPMKDHMPPAQQEKVLNAHLKRENLEISASDWLMPNRTPRPGNTVCMYLSGGARSELEMLFA